jgi:hypothetical protein
MADEAEILSYIIKGQDQTKALLEQHAEVLNRIAASAATMAKSVEDAGKKVQEAAPKVDVFSQFLQDFIGKTNNATNATQNFSGIVSQAWSSPTSLIKDFAATLGNTVTGPMALAIGAAGALATGLGLASAELIEITHDTLDMGASFDDMARKTQASVVGLSSLDYATKALGGSTTSMVNAIYTLQQRLETNPQNIQRGLDEINKSTSGVKVNFEELNRVTRQDGVQGLLLLSDAFSKVSANVDTAAATGDIFTKRFGKDILPLLTRDLHGLADEARDVGYTFSASDAAAAKEAEIEFNKLQLRVEALATQLGRYLIPIANLAAKEIKGFFDNIVFNKETPWGQTITALTDILYLFKQIDKALPAQSPQLFRGESNAAAGPDIAGGSGKPLEEAAAAAKLKTIMDELHGTFEQHKRDLQEAATITKETTNSNLALTIAQIRATEDGFQAQRDIEDKTHQAHVAIINAEFTDAAKRTAALVAEDTNYSAQKLDIENKANKALRDYAIQNEKELARIHDDANASWLTKRLATIDADLINDYESIQKQYGFTTQGLAARAIAEDTARQKRAAAESQADKKFQTDITKVADDIEIARVNAMENGLAKQIELIDRRVKKEQDAAVTLGFTEDQLQAYRLLLGQKADVEKEVARVNNQKKINDELFALETEFNDATIQLNHTGTAVALASLEQQRTAKLRDIQLNHENNKQLIEDTNKVYDAQAEVIKRQGVLNKQQWGEFAADALDAYRRAAEAGVETADQLAQRWGTYWDTQHKQLLDLMQLWDKVGESLTSLFSALERQGGGGALSQFAKAAGDITGHLGQAAVAGTNFAKTLDQINSETLTGTQAVGAFASSLLNVGTAVSQNSSIWGSIASGAVAGFQAGGWYGAVAGAVIAGTLKLIEDDAADKTVEDTMRNIGQSWGRHIGEGLAGEIAKLQKEFNLSAQIAQALDISKIIQETGGFGSQQQDARTFTPQGPEKITGFTQALYAMDTLLQEVRKHGLDTEVALDALNKTFSDLVSFMNRDMHGLVNPEMVNFILNVKKSGENVQAVTQFLSQMAQEAEKGATLVATGFAGSLNTAWKGLADSTSKIEDLATKRADLIDKISHAAVGSNEWQKLQNQLEDVDAQFNAMQGDIDRWRRQLVGAGGDVQGVTDRADRMGRLLDTTFKVGISSGQSFVQALQSIQPGLDQLSTLQKNFGLQVDGTLQHLLDLSDWAKNNKDLANGIDGLNQLTKSLANSAALTQQGFTDLGDEAAAQFKDATAAGLSSDDALQAMQPTLQTLYELQKRFGYQVDASTQDLLDQAKASGEVGDAHESASERAVDAETHIADILERIAQFWGVTLPEKVSNGTSQVVAKTKDVQTQVEIARSHVDDLADSFEMMGDAGSDAGDRANRGVRKVIYGSSPGGLDDLIDHLNKAIDAFNNAGKAAADGMDNANKHTKDYINTLRDLNNQLQLDILGQGLQHDLTALQQQFEAKWRDIQERFKDEPGGLLDAQKALEADLALQRAAIQEKYKIEAAQKQAAADKERADQAYTLQKQLQQTQIQLTQQGIDQQIALLNLQKDEELKALKDKFGDQVDFYNQQAKVIEDIYANRIQAAVNENTAKIEAANQKIAEQQAADQQKLIEQAQQELLRLQEAYTSSLRSLEDQLQDTILDTMQDGIDKQLALLQVQKERRLRALAEQFGAESDMYKQQAAIVDQIYGIQAGELTAQGGNASLTTLQKSFYTLQNSPVQIGQEAARQAELDRLSQQIQAAQGTYLTNATSGIPSGLLPSNLGTVSQLAGATAGGTVRLEVVITDAQGNELSAVDFNSIEEAIATGRITLVARNSSDRSG